MRVQYTESIHKDSCGHLLLTKLYNNPALEGGVIEGFENQ